MFLHQPIARDKTHLRLKRIVQERNSFLWHNIPCVVLTHIFSYLNTEDRLSASSVCRNWRANLFHPKVWGKIVFHINSCDRRTARKNRERNKYLAKNCGRIAQEVVIELNSTIPRDVHTCKDILTVLTANSNLKALSIKPVSCRLEDAGYEDSTTGEKYLKSLIAIIEKAKGLQHLSLGCIEELLEFSEFFLKPLVQHQASTIRSLHISSVKEIPGRNFACNIDTLMFEKFINLESLSIDYDYINNKLVEILSQSDRRPLRKLNIHVHSCDNSNAQDINTATWQQLRKNSPNLEVTITLLHFNGADRKVFDLLNSEMPLTHFRVYFSQFNIEILTRIAFLNNRSLRSLTLIDNLNEDFTPQHTFISDNLDPLIILACRCERLTYLKVIGYRVEAETMVSVANLCGKTLMEFLVPASCIMSSNPERSARSITGNSFRNLKKALSSSLAKPWQPMSLDELDPYLRNVPNAPADGVYLSELLSDQKW